MTPHTMTTEQIITKLSQIEQRIYNRATKIILNSRDQHRVAKAIHRARRQLDEAVAAVPDEEFEAVFK